MCDIPILVINWHGTYTERTKLLSPIDVVKLNAVPMKVCNLLLNNVANSTDIIIKDARNKLIKNKLIKNKSKKSKKSNKSKKSTEDCNKMIQTIKNELFYLDHSGNRLGKYSRRWLPEVHNMAKHLEDDGDVDGTIYLKNVSKSYRIAKWGTDMPYYDKYYSVYKSEKYSRNNKKDNRMILYHADGTSEDLFLSFGTKAKTVCERVKQRNRDTFEVYLSEILHFLHEEKDINSVIIIDFSCNMINNSTITDRNCREMERSSARGPTKIESHKKANIQMKTKKANIQMKTKKANIQMKTKKQIHKKSHKKSHK